MCRLFLYMERGADGVGFWVMRPNHVMIVRAEGFCDWLECLLKARQASIKVLAILHACCASVGALLWLIMMCACNTC